MGAGLGAFAAAGFVAFLWPTATGGFGGKVARRQARRHHRRHPRRQRVLLRARGPHVDHRVPGRRAAEGRGGLRRRHPRRHGAGHRRALPEVPAPRLPRAAVRHAASGSSARATARSTTRSARRRAGRRRVAWTASRSRSPPAATSSSTPAPSYPGRPIGTNTTGQEAEGPHCITGGRRALMIALATTSIALDHLRRSSCVGWIVYDFVNAQCGAAASSARRSSWRPTASRTTTTRCSRAGASSACSSSACCCSSSSSSACRCTGCSSRAARPARPRAARSTLRRVGSRAVRSRRPNGGFNCAGCHGGMKATGGDAPYTVTDPKHRRGRAPSTGTRRR